MTTARNIIKFPERPARRRDYETAFLPAALEVVETPPSPLGRAILATIMGVLAGVTGVGALGLVGSLFYLVGFLGAAFFGLSSTIKMVNELKSVTKNASFAWWPVLVPFYNYYWLWLMVPAEVKRAKQMMGVQAPPRGIVVYVFLWLYALASDINDMAR